MSSLFLVFLVLNLVKVQSQKTTIWTQSLTSGVVPTACQCQNWVDFWQFWIGDPSQVVSITLGGSLTATTYKCSGSAAQFIAFALGTPPFEATQVNCESGIWFTGTITGYGSGNAIGIGSSPTTCSTVAIRPCWGDVNWGGLGSATTCGAPTQTFAVTVVSNIPTVTVPPPSVTWTDSFAYHVAVTSAQCYNWKQFWQNTVPKGKTLSVTLKSSINGGVSATCSGPGVNLLATALFTSTSNGQNHCNEGTVWYFNGLYNGYPNTSAIQIGGPQLCAPSFALRPCWDQPVTANWGGFGGNNCDGLSQTFTATVTIGTSTISNTCWQKLNVKISTGTFIIGCNSIMLKCNTGYTASGYSSSASGLYTCTLAVWSPTVPSCNVVTTTSTSTTTTTKTTTYSSTTTPTTTSTSATTTTTPTTSSSTTTPTTTSTSTTTTTTPTTSSSTTTPTTTSTTTTTTTPTTSSSTTTPTTTSTTATTTTTPTTTSSTATPTTTTQTTTSSTNAPTNTSTSTLTTANTTTSSTKITPTTTSASAATTTVMPSTTSFQTSPSNYINTTNAVKANPTVRNIRRTATTTRIWWLPLVLGTVVFTTIAVLVFVIFGLRKRLARLAREKGTQTL